MNKIDTNSIESSRKKNDRSIYVRNKNACYITKDKMIHYFYLTIISDLLLFK